MYFLIKYLLLFLLIGLLSSPILAETFRLQDIQIEGLERMEAGTVFTYLPLKVNDEFDESNSAEIIRTLYKTGLFKDIQLRREGNILIVVVEERPAIASIAFDGNKILDDEELTEVLTNVGIASGRVFNRSILERLENELTQQYYNFGKYNLKINSQIRELPRNRVDIGINIIEGDVAKIKQVKIVGNSSFEEEELLDDFQSGLKPWYKFWGTRDRYSKPKLEGDLEILRGHYLNNGYIRFDVRSTQVSITPNKEDIFVTINVTEGEQYTLEEIKLTGKFIVPKEELEALAVFTPGETFSRKRVVQITQGITRRLGDEGFAFPNINPVPEINEENKTVSLTYFIDPGLRMYVRRINLRGHESTRDEVYRREFRQMEGGWYSETNIETSRARIKRLAFVEEIEIDTQRIPGVEDQVDLEITITERLAGSFNVGAGFSDSQGAVVTTSVNQENFLGTGKTVGFSINTSSVNTVYDLSYVNPYYTIDGVSRGFGGSFVSTEASEADVSDFDSEQWSLRVNYGIPLTEVSRIGTAFAIRHTEIGLATFFAQEILDFVEDNGDEYTNLRWNLNYTRDTRNRSLFANKGSRQNIRTGVTLPAVSDLEYFKLGYEITFYFPLSQIFTLSMGSEIGYGDAFGDTTDLPFFEKYRAGGFDSVRGYASNSLGPRDSLGEPYGGNFLSTARVQVSFPPPFFQDKNRAKLNIFVDAGNVFEEIDDFEAGEVRGSFGLGVTLITGLGGVSAALATTFNDDGEDDTEGFQFNLGSSF